MAIIGLRSVADFTVDGQRPKNWREGILMLYPNGGATLAALTALLKERVVDDPEYNWYERELTNRRFQISVDLNASDSQTEINILTTSTYARTDTRELKIGDLLWIEYTSEIVRVASDPTAAGKVIVDRGWASSTKTLLDVTSTGGQNPNMFVMGSAYEEGSTAPTGVQLDPTKYNNYTQIFRQTLEFTRTAMKTRLRTGDQVVQAKKDALEMLSMDMERAFLFGKKSETTYNNKPLRTTDGIITKINAADSSNIVSASTSGTTMATLETYLERAFRYGADEKIALVGNGALMAIQQIIRKNSHYQITNGLKEFGMNVARLTTPFGDLVLKRYTLFNNNADGTTATGANYYGMNRWCLILDASQLVYTYLKGSDIAFQSNLQANGLDGEKSGYLGECSIEVHNGKTHMLIKSLVSGKADT